MAECGQCVGGENVSFVGEKEEGGELCIVLCCIVLLPSVFLFGVVWTI